LEEEKEKEAEESASFLQLGDDSNPGLEPGEDGSENDSRESSKEEDNSGDKKLKADDKTIPIGFVNRSNAVWRKVGDLTSIDSSSEGNSVEAGCIVVFVNSCQTARCGSSGAVNRWQ